MTTTTSTVDSTHAPNQAPAAPPRNPFAVELAVTAAYQRAAAEDIFARELACLRAMYPAVMQPVRPGDLFAGRIQRPLVGLSSEPGGLAYYCNFEQLCAISAGENLAPAQRDEVHKMLDFWNGRTTEQNVRAAYSPQVAAALPEDAWMSASAVAFPLYRIAGTQLDYVRLLRLGIPGLRAELDARHKQTTEPAKRRFFEALQSWLDVLADTAAHYARQARALAADAADSHARANLQQIVDVLDHISAHAPQSLRQAIQLMWLYALLSSTWNYGRMDVYLGPFLARDKAAGIVDDAGALSLLQSLWRLITANNNQFNNRVIVGGLGRPDEATADAFALLAIEASRTVFTNQPQLSLRFYGKQNPALLEHGLASIGEGRTFPLLYNDDVNVPAVASAFAVPLDEAEQYLPFGCGEYILDHRSVGTPNGVINLTKALEVTLHNGVDPISKKPAGIRTGAIASLATFDDLWAAYARQVEHFVAVLAEQEKLAYDVTANQAAFLPLSLLYDDCLERGKPLLAGGARYLGGTLESYGNITCSDSLAAIDQIVFRQRQCSLEQLVAACDANFVGHAGLRKSLLELPKYGNDDDTADAMAQRVHNHVCHAARNQAARVGLHSYLIVIINNHANVAFGRTTAASADGRFAAAPLANANNPTPGMDRRGTTAFLNSLVKLDPALHAGAVQNMKFAKAMFTTGYPKLRALLEVYFARGGAQAMITVVNRDDLESAMREPEKWGHLMVRVGGFTARFIDLPRDVQLDILERTLNE